jgi:Fuc2NAc and GlcNAc transferase
LTDAELTLIASAAFLVSVLITGLVRRFALAHDLVDVPNQRSSHRTPTPRGGGVSVVVATTAALGVLAWMGAIRTELLMALVGGGLAVAVIGLVDDRRSAPPLLRFTVQLAAAAWALAWLGGLGPLQLGSHVTSLGWAGYVLGALGLLWVLNLFNFMDGIDGIAASEATFVAWGGAWLTAAVTPASGGVAEAAVVLGAACLGFLRWNWPPACIFLGDVGSGYLGYVIGVLALAAARENPAAIWVWLILGGLFFVDATVTLVRRLLRAERVYEAHRNHAYQRVARRWHSHGKVTLAVMGINISWLLPCAVFAARRPSYAAACAVAALTPLVVLVAIIGSIHSTGGVQGTDPA